MGQAVRKACTKAGRGEQDEFDLDVMRAPLQNLTLGQLQMRASRRDVPVEQVQMAVSFNNPRTQKGSLIQLLRLAERAGGRDDEKAAYLVFDPQSSGVMNMIWSRTKIDGALAKGLPMVDVPDFKFARDGKAELVRNINGNKKAYYLAWTMFVKRCHQFDCIMTDLDAASQVLPLSLVLHSEDLRLQRVQPNLPFALDGVDAVAAVHKDFTSFDIQTLVKNKFMALGHDNGAVVEVTAVSRVTSPTKAPTDSTPPKGAVSLPANSDNAAYLVFEPGSNGVMHMIWSRTKVDGALAKGVPTAPVPDFKYSRDGKSELVRNINGKKGAYYLAWLMFVKRCQQFECVLVDLDHQNAVLPLSLVLHLDDMKLQRIPPAAPFSLKGVDVVAAVHKDFTALDLETMGKEKFMALGHANGAVVEISTSNEKGRESDAFTEIAGNAGKCSPGPAAKWDSAPAPTIDANYEPQPEPQPVKAQQDSTAARKPPAANPTRSGKDLAELMQQRRSACTELGSASGTVSKPDAAESKMPMRQRVSSGKINRPEAPAVQIAREHEKAAQAELKAAEEEMRQARASLAKVNATGEAF
jgi:hypothetical protein